MSSEKIEIPFMPNDRKYEKLTLLVSARTKTVIEKIRDQTSLIKFDDMKKIAKILEEVCEDSVF